jgi:hypothetical protein
MRNLSKKWAISRHRRISRSGNRSPQQIYRFHPKSRGYEGEEKSHNLDKLVLDLVYDAEEVRDSARAHPSRF